MGSRLLPANWRVRPRLVALILLPTAAAVLLSGLQLTASLSTAAEYGRMVEVASLVEGLGTLSHEMAEERDLTAWYIANNRNAARFKRVKDQQQTVDRTSKQVLAAIDGLDDAQTVRVRTETSQMRRWLEGLPGLRKLITGSNVLPRASLGMYSRMIADFITLHDDLGRSGGDERLIGDALALGALTRAKEQVARERGILLVGLIQRKFDFDDPADFLGAYKSQESELASFRATATADDIKRFRDVVSGPKIDRADAMRALVMSRMRENKPLARLGITEWYDSSTAMVDGMRTVERGLSAAVVARSQEMESAEQRSAFISGAAILVLLVLILLITAWVAGTLVRPLRRLRTEALEVADTRLPETVRVLRESGDRAPTRRGALHRSGLPRRDRGGGPGLRRGPPRGHPAGGRRGRAAEQRQRDVRQPLPAQPVAHGAADRPHRRPGAGRAGRRPAGQPLQAGPPGHPYAPQLREPPGPRRPGAEPPVE